MQLQRAAGPARPNRLPPLLHVDEEFNNIARRAPEGGVAGAHDAYPLQEPHPPVHLEAEVGHERGPRLPERADAGGVDIGRQLARRRVAPRLGDPFCIERRELPLDLVLEREVQRARPAGPAVAQGGLRLARIVRTKTETKIISSGFIRQDRS